MKLVIKSLNFTILKLGEENNHGRELNCKMGQIRTLGVVVRMNCNLTTCRYNKNGKCTSEEDRKICVDVAKKVLCVGESEEDGV